MASTAVESAVDTTPTPDDAASTVEAPKSVETPVTTADPVESLSADNKGFFSRMSEAGRNLAHQAYEGLYKIPGVNRIVGRLEIAYNQAWMDRHQEKAAALKGRMDSLDVRSGTLDKSSQEIETVIADLKQRGMSGIESLQLKVEENTRKKLDLETQRDNLQSRLEARNDKMRLYGENRDRIADRFIGKYDEKLRPMETQLESLQTRKDEAELSLAVAQAKHKAEAEKLDDLTKSKAQIEEALRKTGMSERQIAGFEAVKNLGDIISRGREKIRTEGIAIAEKKTAIDRRIAAVEASANVYRNKQKEFTRVKERKPLEVKPGEKKEPEAKEEKSAAASSTPERVPEKAREKEQQTVEGLIFGWNNFLKEQADYRSEDLISLDDFSKATGLSGEFSMDLPDFKDILGKYLKVKKLPTSKYLKYIDGYIENIRSSPKT